MDYIENNQEFDELIYEYYNLCNEERKTIIVEKYNKIENDKHELNSMIKKTKNHTRPLRIGFVGGFSTGKSSIINSLIGEQLLGVKIEPATAQITELRYGGKFEILEAVFENNELVYNKISLENYKKKSVHRGVKGKIDYYEITHPSKNLNRFTIVDTPGFSSTSKEDDALTKKWIKGLDLLIWIFDINKVGDKAEFDLIKEYTKGVRTIGIINKVDQKAPKVREKIKEEITKTKLINDVYFYSAKKVFDYHDQNKNLETISNQIKKLINEEKNFDVKKNNTEIVFNVEGTNSLVYNQPKKNEYIKYYELFLTKIDNVRNHEINKILNNSIDIKYNQINFTINELIVSIKESLEGVKKELNKSLNLLKVLENNFLDIVFDKIDARFKVFYTGFFQKLVNDLIYKKVDRGVFSDTEYICMRNVTDEKIMKSLNITATYNDYLIKTLILYKKEIEQTIVHEYSDVHQLIDNKHSIIQYLIDKLIIATEASILGYYNNFRFSEIENFYEEKEFHKNNLDLVIPDELLNLAIGRILEDDFYRAFYTCKRELEDEISRSDELIKRLNNIKVI